MRVKPSVGIAIIALVALIMLVWVFMTLVLSNSTNYLTIHGHHCIVLGELLDRSISCDWAAK